jgi:hypothetical protein
MPSNWKCVRQFLKSSKREQIIRLPLAPPAMKSAIPLLLTRPLETLATLWQALSALFFKSTEPLRPGRRYPHKPKRKNEFYPCYKKIG